MPTLPPSNPAIPRCPRCRAKDVIKKGTRNTLHEARQRWGCNACGHTFINQITTNLVTISWVCAILDEGNR